MRLAGRLVGAPAYLHLWNGHLPAGARRAVEPLGGGSRGVRLRTGGAGGVAPAGRFPADQTIRRAEVPRPQGGGAADFLCRTKGILTKLSASSP